MTEPNYAPENIEVKKIAFFTNPDAAKGRATEAGAEALAEFENLGLEVESHAPVSREAALEELCNAFEDDSIDAVVVCGGDGTISNGVKVQAQRTKPLGIIPAGSGNDLARVLGIPTDAKEAAQIVARGKAQHYDLGLITPEDGREPEWFDTIMCAGMDSVICDYVNKWSWPHGKARYLAAEAYTFLSLKGYPTKITFEDGTVVEGRYCMCSFGNTAAYGAGMYICPDADPQDGIMDITCVEYRGKIHLAKLSPKLRPGEHIGEPGVTTYRAKKVRVEIEGAPLYADGDYKAVSPVTCEIVAGAGRYLVP